MKYEFHCLDGGGEMEMLVSDNGSGLAKELMNHSEKIFELGVKATPPKDMFPGSGIGLYHAKDLLNKMNADISFVGNDNKLGGAVFKVVFKK
jgi:K+-sensing histidine kinase KdpD